MPLTAVPKIMALGLSNRTIQPALRTGAPQPRQALAASEISRPHSGHLIIAIVYTSPYRFCTFSLNELRFLLVPLRSFIPISSASLSTAPLPRDFLLPFYPPPKKVKCFLEELYISGISNKIMPNCCVSSQRLWCRRVTTFQKIGFSEISCLKSPSKFQIRTENAPADLPTSAFILLGALLPNSVQDLLDTTVITFTQMRRSAAELCGVALN